MNLSIPQAAERLGDGPTADIVAPALIESGDYYSGLGSLVWIGPNVAVSAAHVARGADGDRTIYATNHAGTPVAGTVTFFDPTIQIAADGRIQPATMERDLIVVTFLELMTNDWARLDDDGFADGPVTMAGWVAGWLYSTATGHTEEVTNFVLSTNPATARPGQSGGGLFDAQGELVGIISTTSYSVDLRGHLLDFVTAQAESATRGFLSDVWAAIEPHPERYADAGRWCVEHGIGVEIIASVTGYTSAQVSEYMEGIR